MARFPKYSRIKNYLLSPPRPNRIRAQEYYTDYGSIVRENPTEIERISIALQASQANDQTDQRTSEEANGHLMGATAIGRAVYKGYWGYKLGGSKEQKGGG